MKLFDWLAPKKIINGYLGYFQLYYWWNSEFSEEERNYIIRKYNDPDLTITDMSKMTTSLTSSKMLKNLASYFITKKDAQIGLKILNKAEEIGTLNNDIVSLHFIYNHMIEVYYKLRKDDISALAKVESICYKSINISSRVKPLLKKQSFIIPSHPAYDRLIYIRMEENNYREAKTLASQAKAQGWAGNWSEIIRECTRREE